MTNEVRYERRGETYSMKMWDVTGGDSQEMHGQVSEQPGWLRNIILMARIGDHMRKVVVPPPDEIIWFKIDDRYNLIGFDQ